MRGRKLDYYLIPCRKVNYRWIADTNVKSKTIKHIGDNKKVTSCP